ncbi:V-type proton ATPase subunit D-like isoform X3 [Maniola jurtina]|uniref:V-type proton ATPase subunit D-like isoform X3 n=1 Tax=Maniola jurtina TaxID=191418 RepID=UPI001E689DCF|nr:V-type proton ATPase subunit D-like isoform X3 [Maniola jurtina]
MKDDDDEEADNTFGVQRYPCMPSLVALQQMRNRLHLAFLGKKLMKWTALATGRELRHIAAELYKVYDGFSVDVRNAFILLARSRYFYPQLNHIVTEDIAEQAAVVVRQATKQVSSVKITQFEIVETEHPAYAHLGLEKGGQTIQEAKKAWLELLKRLILMMQLRTSFLMVEEANRNATKKSNVLAKIVIPRLNATAHYITSELEEKEREEVFRLKRVKQKKDSEKHMDELKRMADEDPKVKNEAKSEGLVVLKSEERQPAQDKAD